MVGLYLDSWKIRLKNPKLLGRDLSCAEIVKEEISRTGSRGADKTNSTPSNLDGRVILRMMPVLSSIWRIVGLRRVQ